MLMLPAGAMAGAAAAGGSGGLWTGIGSALSGLGSGFLGSFGSGLMSGVKGLGSSLAGGLFGGGGSSDDFEGAYWLAQDANAFNRYSAMLQNDWNLNYQSIANRHADDAATIAFNRSKDEYAKRFQTAAQDMRAAGLNPILAASGGFQVGGQPNAPMAQSFSGSTGLTAPAVSVATGAKELAAIRMMEKEGRKVEAETDKVGVDIRKVESEVNYNHQKISESIDYAAKLRAEKDLITEEELNVIEKFKEIQANIKNIEMQTYRIAQEVRESESRQSLNYSQTDVNRAKLGEIKANIAKLGEEVRNLGYVGKELRVISELYDSAVGASLVYGERAARGGYLGSLLRGSYDYRNPFRDFINDMNKWRK